MWKVFLGAAFGGLMASLTGLFAQRIEFRLLPMGMTYAELAATVLAGAALILAALGFFIAVLAVLGWSQFRGLVKKSATETARSHIDTRLQDGDLRVHFEVIATQFLDRQFEAGALRTMIEKRVDQVIYGGVAGRSVLGEDDENENLEE